MMSVTVPHTHGSQPLLVVLSGTGVPVDPGLYSLGLSILVLGGVRQSLTINKVSAHLDAIHRQVGDSRQVYIYGQGKMASLALKVSLTYPRPLGGVIVSGGEISLEADWRKMLPASAFYAPRLVLQKSSDLQDAETARSILHELLSVGLPVTIETAAETEIPVIIRWLKARARSPLSRLPAAVRHMPSQIETRAQV